MPHRLVVYTDGDWQLTHPPQCQQASPDDCDVTQWLTARGEVPGEGTYKVLRPGVFQRDDRLVSALVAHDMHGKAAKMMVGDGMSWQQLLHAAVASYVAGTWHPNAERDQAARMKRKAVAALKLNTEDVEPL